MQRALTSEAIDFIHLIDAVVATVEVIDAVNAVDGVGLIRTRGIGVVENNAELTREGQELAGAVDNTVLVSEAEVLGAEDVLRHRLGNGSCNGSGNESEDEGETESVHVECAAGPGCWLEKRRRSGY